MVHYYPQYLLGRLSRVVLCFRPVPESLVGPKVRWDPAGLAILARLFHL